MSENAQLGAINIKLLCLEILIRANFVIPAKAGIQKKPWLLLTAPNAGKPGFRVKPGMTDIMRLM